MGGYVLFCAFVLHPRPRVCVLGQGTAPQTTAISFHRLLPRSWFISKVSSLIEAALIEAALSGLREYGAGWFEKEKEGTVVMDLFSKVADMVAQADGDVVLSPF